MSANEVSSTAAAQAGSGRLTLADGGRAELQGALSFHTVTALLKAGEEAIRQGRADVIDLSGVTASDSAGLALLIEWLSLAKAAGRELRYQNIPAQLTQLARLSELEPLLGAT